MAAARHVEEARAGLAERCPCLPGTRAASTVALRHRDVMLCDGHREGKGCRGLLWTRPTVAKARTGERGGTRRRGCGHGARGRALHECCRPCHPSSLHILAWHVVVMIAMEIIPACFVVLRCCVLQRLAGRLLDWF